MTTFNIASFPAGKTTTNEEIEEMLESGNLAVFTQDVSIYASCKYRCKYLCKMQVFTLDVKYLRKMQVFIQDVSIYAYLHKM